MYSGAIFRAPAIAVLLICLAGSFGLNAAQWRTVEAERSIIRLLDWPDDLPCRYSDGGYNAAYSMKRSGVICPAIPSPVGDRTSVIVLELQPGYYWSGGYAKDVRELWIFKRKTGYFAYFKDARFEDGQRFKCYNDSECGFRVIRFSVGEQPCRLIYYNPDIGNTDGTTGRSNTPFSIVLIHCGSDVEFARKHFALAPDRVTISYPDARLAPKTKKNPSLSDTALCRMALNGSGDGWQELGFAPYVETARRRGLSVSTCKALTHILRPEKSAKKPAADKNQPATSTGFTGCFDNPKNCR